jgi:hypothetical protein
VSGQRHAPTALSPGERALDTHWIGGWVRLRAGLDVVEKRKNLAPAGNRTPAVQPVPVPTEICRASKHATLDSGAARGDLTVSSGSRRREPSVPL